MWVIFRERAQSSKESSNETAQKIWVTKSVKLADHSWTIEDWEHRLGNEEKESNAIYSPIFELKKNKGLKLRLKAMPTYKEDKVKRTSKPALKISLELVDGKMPSGDVKFRFKYRRRLGSGCFGSMHTVWRSNYGPLVNSTYTSLTSEEFPYRDLTIKILIVSVWKVHLIKFWILRLWEPVWFIHFVINSSPIVLYSHFFKNFSENKFLI